MRTKKRLILCIGALLLAAAMCIWYGRPMTLEEICPGVKLDQCTKINAVYSTYSDKGLNQQTTLLPEDEAFPRLLELLQERQFCRSPLWWIPRGTRTHRVSREDFKWDLSLVFENVPLPDGSAGTGYMLHLNNFFGDLDLRFDGETWPIRTADQEQWLSDVMGRIMGHN